MFVRATVVGFVSSVSIAILAVLLCISPAVAEGGASGSFPDRMFSVVRSTPVGSGDTFEVELLPQATGEWWVTADAVAGSFLRVSVWRNNAGSMVLETSSKLRSAGETSVKTSLTAGIAYRAIFAQFGRPGTSVLREQFTWVRQDGAAGPDTIYDITTVGSSVYATGFETIPAQDALLRKFDSGGGVVWTRQFGAADFDYGLAIDVTGTEVYVAGRASGFSGCPSGACGGAFVRKYDSDGNEMWTRAIGTEAFAVDADGTSVYVAGWTDGTLPGQSSAGSADAFICKYDSDGNEIWTRQFGTSGYDVAHDIEASGLYVAGRTGGAFPGQSNAGSEDAFLARQPR